jgi:hypothetical protein
MSCKITNQQVEKTCANCDGNTKVFYTFMYIGVNISTTETHSFLLNYFHMVHFTLLKLLYIDIIYIYSTTHFEGIPKYVFMTLFYTHFTEQIGIQ